MPRKATNDRVTHEMLHHRVEGLKLYGYPKPKWIEFCERLLPEGYTITLYEARRTHSKYINVSRGKAPSFKVRFSNHAPILSREINGDCDFFVGRTNLSTTTTSDALAAVFRHFSKYPLDAPPLEEDYIEDVEDPRDTMSPLRYINTEGYAP